MLGVWFFFWKLLEVIILECCLLNGILRKSFEDSDEYENIIFWKMLKIIEF